MTSDPILHIYMLLNLSRDFGGAGRFALGRGRSRQVSATGAPSHGERCAAQLVLAVWNPEEPWQSGKFYLMEALRVFDAQHHRALTEWALSPWAI